MSMAEIDWNNNGEAIDAALRDTGVVPPQPRDETPVSTGPFVVRDWDSRFALLEGRVTLLEERPNED